MHTVQRTPAGMRALARAAVLSLLLGALCACAPGTQHDADVATDTAAARPSSAPAAAPSTFAADEALAIASARDQAVRAAREQTLRVQRQLVEQRRATHDAAQRGDGNARCIAGQKMRRVANGWVQAGGC